MSSKPEIKTAKTHPYAVVCRYRDGREELHSLERTFDDAFRVAEVANDGAAGVKPLKTLDIAGFFVRAHEGNGQWSGPRWKGEK